MSEMTFPVEPTIIRGLSPEHDLPAWLALIHAIEQEKNSTQQVMEEYLRRLLDRPEMRCWVVESPAHPDALIAYGFLFAQIPERSVVEVSVHPESRHKGLGRRVLASLVEEARKSGARWVYNEIADTDMRGIAFLQHNGFQPAGDVWVLRAEANTDFDEPAWPEGYSVRSFAEVGDVEIMRQACNRGFGDMWGHHENTAGGVTVEDLTKWMKIFDLNGVFIVFAPDGSPIGSCRALPGDDEDLVDEPGVAPEHRHYRLQRPMVLTALAWLRKQGQKKPVRLESWGDTPETVELYKGIGFQLVEHAVSLKYDL
jgi:mycothiol synthase